MAKNRKTFGSRKLIATLPYLVAPSNKEIDQMEINFYLDQTFQSRSYPPGFDFDEEDRFLVWMMEIEDRLFDQMTDDYLCMKMQSRYRSLSQKETAYLDSMKWADSEAWSWKLSPTMEAFYECMFIESFYSTGEWKYSGYKPKSVEGYLAITSIDDRRALYASLGIDGYTSHNNRPHVEDDEDLHLDRRDDCQINGYQAFMYWNDDGQDMPQSMQEFEERFCPEQAIVREIPLHGLKQAHRRELICEYAVI